MHSGGAPVLLAESRRRAIAELVREAGAVSVAEVESRFGVSSMTARRDLQELERQGLLRRTHGGAVLPDVSAHEDSFAQRVETASDAKLALAASAADLVAAGETIFLDSSSTTFYLARRIVESGLAVTILTNSLPVMDLVAAQASPQVDVIGIGGALRRLTRSFVGPAAVHAVRSHFADRLFFSIKGLAEDGTMTDADALEAEVKRAMISRAESSVLLLDGSKLSVRGLNAIAELRDINGVIAHGVAPAQMGVLKTAGVLVRSTGGSR
jgi:DeoR/GlpR family transcriptional regulator of sugar metabolism